ncbi:hypothetical protein [Marinivivus vitaminiproducens]|uniref:hypothetical protein n=1 Tax=Marinivivus vitaminiproducens TaxID=3035935 RepID=UPI00279926CB|nr:hypothetical protein P4R82_11540 [Geminicoccaceae bacterium SCSIO 64248]
MTSPSVPAGSPVTRLVVTCPAPEQADRVRSLVQEVLDRSDTQAAILPEPVAPRSGRAGPPPRHKMALVMLVSVYPTITILLWLMWPLIVDLPHFLRTLALSLIMVPIMTWLVVPFVTRCFMPWLAGGPLLPRLSRAKVAS